MSIKNQKKRSVNGEPSDQTPPKKQKKQIPKSEVSSTDAKAANGENTAAAPLTASQRKRQKNKNRKLAAIARVKEAGGIPKLFSPGNKEKKAKEEGEKTEKTEGGGEEDKKKKKKKINKVDKNMSVEEQLKAKQEKRAESKKLRQEKRQQSGQYKAEQVNLTADEIRLRIAEIKGRGEISKTARRKLAVFIKKLAIEEGTAVSTVPTQAKRDLEDESNLSKSEKRRLRREKQGIAGDKKDGVSEGEDDPGVEKPVDIQVFQKKKQQQKAAAVTKTGKKPVTVASQVEVAKAAAGKIGNKQNKGKQSLIKADQKTVIKAVEVKTQASDDEEKEDDEEEEEEEEEEEQEEEEEETVSTPQIGGDVEEESSDDEEEELEDEEDDEEEEEEEDKAKIEKVEKPVKKEKAKGKKGEIKEQKEQGQGVKRKLDEEQNSSKKKRYILFVGNIPFESKPEDLKTHFLTKVGEVSSVRIPTKPGTQTPRGFGYVEVTNDVDYEKGLSLHHTMLNGRRINVEYTLSGSKQVGKRQELVSKNQKLHAMRKAGKLAGSQKHDQKRSVRRFKKKEHERQAQ